MRLKTLNGAPLCEHLNFHPGILRPASETDPAIEEFLRGSLNLPTAPTASVVVRWRRLDPQPGKLRSGWSQPYLPGSTSFNGNSDIPIPRATADPMGSLADEVTELDSTNFFPEDESDYLNHSLDQHDTLVSSQIVPDISMSRATEEGDTTSFVEASFDTGISTPLGDTDDTSQTSVMQLPPSLTILNLKDLPTSRYLWSIYPQTPTPTFLCVLMSPVVQREVLVRKGNYRMILYELSVADDTSSGFKTTFWFRPAKKSGPPPDVRQERLRETLDDLNVGDVLLLRNIVLTIYRDTVFGQSLNPNISRARTDVSILMRANGKSMVKHIVPLAVESKFVDVKHWARIHVAPDNKTRKRKEEATDFVSAKRNLRRSRRLDDSLPPDTPQAA